MSLAYRSVVIFTILLIILNNCCFIANATISKRDKAFYEHNFIPEELQSFEGSTVSFVKLREKRDTYIFSNDTPILTTTTAKTVSVATESNTGDDDLQMHLTLNSHEYYNSSVYINHAEAIQMLDSIKNLPYDKMLSESSRRAKIVELSFDFPFYGQPIRKIAITSGGFLFTGDYIHSWLAATQYIAPLMAHFDTSMSNDSFVRFNDNGTAFSVVWENVYLLNKKDLGSFTFMTTLFQSGDILFAYHKIPISIDLISDEEHPVKIGLSDAYLLSRTVSSRKHKTIYEYHRINFVDKKITNSTIVRLTALPTCHSYMDCGACVNNELNSALKCKWCPALAKCSTGIDRNTQEWVAESCDRSQVGNYSACTND